MVIDLRKCDGCKDRVASGDEPACVEVCKVDALVYGELNELIERGRVRTTGAVLAAAGLSTPEWPEGDPLAEWRSFGAEREDAGARAHRLTSVHQSPVPAGAPTSAHEKEATP